jgi:hypothetical protein
MSKVVDSDALRQFIDENEYETDVPVPPPTPDKFQLIWPCPDPKVITQWYGINPQWYAPFGLPGHEGLDMRALNGTPIWAMADGEVIRVENVDNNAYGIHVRLKHMFQGQEFKTVYGHFQETKVKVGDKVVAGQVIGLADNTGNSSGPHLHITLKRTGQGSPWMNTSDIVNPTPYLPDLFPDVTLPGFDGWRLDVGGNFRTSPEVAANNTNLIRYLAAGSVVQATGEVDWETGGDWWQVIYNSITGWFWNPGYKLSAI